MSTFTIKRGDLKPTLDASLKNTDGTVVDLTGKTVKFVMRNQKAKGTLLQSRPTPRISAAATIVDAPTGAVRYTWLDGDTDEAGTYDAEFEVTFVGGAKQTFPGDGFFTIVIPEDLG